MKLNSLKDIVKRYRENNFFTHSKNYFIAELFNKAIVFLTIPIFTRMLIPEEYGILSIFNTIITVFSILMGLNFHGAVTRKYYDKSDDFQEFLGSNILFLLGLNTVLVGICYCLKSKMASFFAVSSDVFFIAIVISSFGFFIQLELSYLQASQQSKRYAQISVVRNILITSAAIVWVYLLKENRYLGKIYSQLIVTGIIFIFVIYNLKKISSFKIFDKQAVKYSLAFGVPLIPHALSGYILNIFDRIIINQVSGSYATGIYSFAYNVGMIMMVFVTALCNTWTPFFFENMKNGDYKKIQEMAEKNSKIIFLIALVLSLFGKEIIVIMADEKYFTALSIIPIVVMGYVFVFMYQISAVYSFYVKKTWLISIFTFIAGFVSVGLNYIFIPKYGYIAAAWVTLASYGLLFLLHYLNTRFIIKEKIIEMKSILINLIFLATGIVIYITYEPGVYIGQIIFKTILIVLFAWLYFRNNIRKVNE